MDNRTILITAAFGLLALYGLTTSFLEKLPPHSKNQAAKTASDISKTSETTPTPTINTPTSATTPTQTRIQKNIRFIEQEDNRE